MKLRNMTSIYLEREGEILCLYRIGSRVANQRYVGTAGGHFENSELNDPKACVLREMWEELGLRETDVQDMRLRYITYRRKDEEIRQNYYYFAKWDGSRELVSTEGKLRWISYEELPELNMPVSAKHMMLHYLQQGRFCDDLYGGITEENGTVFREMREFEG